MIPTPNSCAQCGREQRGHFTWFTAAGRHVYIPPTDAQRKARMLARRAAKKGTPKP